MKKTREGKCQIDVIVCMSGAGLIDRRRGWNWLFKSQNNRNCRILSTCHHHDRTLMQHLNLLLYHNITAEMSNEKSQTHKVSVTDWQCNQYRRPCASGWDMKGRGKMSVSDELRIRTNWSSRLSRRSLLTSSRRDRKESSSTHCCLKDHQSDMSGVRTLRAFVS